MFPRSWSHIFDKKAFHPQVLEEMPQKFGFRPNAAVWKAQFLVGDSCWMGDLGQITPSG